MVEWKRVQGPDGRLQGFGFCTFNTAEDALRCERILTGAVIYGKDIKVRADDKAQANMDEYAKQRDEAGQAALDAEAKLDEAVRTELKPILSSVGASLAPPETIAALLKEKREKKKEAAISSGLQSLREAATSEANGAPGDAKPAENGDSRPSDGRGRSPRARSRSPPRRRSRSGDRGRRDSRRGPRRDSRYDVGSLSLLKALISQ